MSSDFTKMVCCKLHLNPILWELKGAEHDSGIVSDMRQANVLIQIWKCLVQNVIKWT